MCYLQDGMVCVLTISTVLHLHYKLHNIMLLGSSDMMLLGSSDIMLLGSSQ